MYSDDDEADASYVSDNDDGGDENESGDEMDTASLECEGDDDVKVASGSSTGQKRKSRGSTSSSIGDITMRDNGECAVADRSSIFSL